MSPSPWQGLQPVRSDDTFQVLGGQDREDILAKCAFEMYVDGNSIMGGLIELTI